MTGGLQHVDSYTGHVMRESSLMDDIDLKGEPLLIKPIEKWKGDDKHATNTIY